MIELVLTIIGRDRAGAVAELADVVRFHEANWKRSELAELAGTFAGVVSRLGTSLDTSGGVDRFEIIARPVVPASADLDGLLDAITSLSDALGIHLHVDDLTGDDGDAT